jgi:ketosteroid isomerase-like protein
MSQDGRIEVIRRALDAWNRRDIEDLLAISTPEIEYVNSPTAVEPGTRRGPQEVTAALQAQWEILLDARQEIDRMVEHGDAIFTLGRVSRRMPGSEARIEQSSSPGRSVPGSSRVWRSWVSAATRSKRR